LPINGQKDCGDTPKIGNIGVDFEIRRAVSALFV
jgi:hypothetical protein